MENAEETSKWIPTSFATSEAAEGTTITSEAAEGTTITSEAAEGIAIISEVCDVTTATSEVCDGATATSKAGDGATAISEVGEGATATSEVGDGAAATSEVGEGATATSEVGDGTTVTSEAGDGATATLEAGDGATAISEAGDGATAISEAGEGAAATSEVGDGDSLSSFISATTPGSTAVDQQSNDQSFDVNLLKSVVSNEENNEKSSVEVASAINVFEEDARSSWSEEPKQTEYKETAIDDSSRNSHSSQKSANSQKSSAKKPCSDDEGIKRDFSPEKLFEYMWPQENGEFYLLQEQICDYVNVKSFKRKYPDLVRRTVDMDEKRFLREKGVVTEMQCDLGLTALRSEDVLELMSKDYPDHYKEYIKVLRDKEKQSITEKQKEYAATNSDKNKMVDLVKKAVQSAAEYNAHLNQERREERKSCMDLQTFTIHYPVKKNKIKKNIKPGRYPVALLPGQFQDYYKEYTPEELKYLPVNTVLYGPLKELNSIKALSDGSQSDSDDSTASDGSCCSSSQGTHDDSSSSSEKPEANNKKVVAPSSPYQPKVKPNALCKVCKNGPEGKTKDGKPEELVHCSDCENSAHPSCIELTSDVVNVLKTYPWQCMDCKVCSHCRDPNDEDKMLFCDTCDRGYHTFCVGLKSLPQGKWICRQCGSCSVCGATRPGPESSKAQWQYDTTKENGNENDVKNRHVKILCQLCFKKKK